MKRLTEIKPYSPKELAGYYNVCTITFEKWLVPFRQYIGERQGRFYTVNQVKVILEKIGVPCSAEEYCKTLPFIFTLWMAV